MAKSLLPPVIVGLFVFSVANGLPLPRLVLPQEAGSIPAVRWELRPTSRQYANTADENFLYSAYIQGRFDPDRPYIQMIVPRGDGIANYEAKPTGPFGPTRKPPTTVATTVATTVPTEELPIECINSTNNSTLNITVNGTVCNESLATVPSVSRPLARLMLADGRRIYPIDGAQGQRNEWSPSGAYELAYTTYRPRTVSAVSPQFFPVIQYADYNYFGWPGGYPAGGTLEPVYIYRPVYPSALRSYDVYYYLPVAESQSDAERETAKTNAEKVEASEITMPNALDNSEANPQVQTHVEVVPTTSTSQKEVESQENPGSESDNDKMVKIEEEHPATEIKNEQMEIAEAEPEEKTGEGRVAEAEPGEKTVESEEDSPSNWEKELESISDQDLMAAIEKVLQEIHSRLSD